MEPKIYKEIQVTEQEEGYLGGIFGPSSLN